MRTAFNSSQLAEPAVAAVKPEIEKCRHYGFCTATCPTYVLLGDERDSPRGRIDIIQNMLEQGGEPSPEAVTHLDRCLSCMGCITTCPTSIHYAKLNDVGREYVEKHHRRKGADRALRAILAAVLPRPTLFRLSLAAAAIGRPIGKLLGNSVAAMLRMAGGVKAGTSAFAGSEWVPAENGVSYRVALLEGCVQRVIGTSISDATIRLLSRSGCEVWKPASMGCCGSLPLHMGKGDEARQYARQMVDILHPAIERGELDAIIVDSSGCGTTMKDYGHILEADPHYADMARAVSKRTFDIAQWLVKIGFQGSASLGLRVAYHDPCSLQHAQRVTSQPRELLKSVGCEVLNIPERQMCCGSAGTYNLLQPEIASQLGERKARNIERVAPDLLATGNIGCITQIRQHSDVTVLHLVELLDWATGGPRPSGVAETLVIEGRD